MSTIRTMPTPPSDRLIVVVDDNLHALRGMRNLLAAHGFRVVAASRCDDLARELHALAGQKVDAVIADLHLGCGGSGLDAIRMVRQAHGDTVAGLLLTGDVDVHPGAAALAGLSIAFKPLVPARLIALIESMTTGVCVGGR